METLGALAFLLLIGWQVVMLRKDVASLRYSTTILYSIESAEKDDGGVPYITFNLTKKFQLPIAITPGMEFSGIANNKPTVMRVVFDSEGKSVHLRPGIIPHAEMESSKNWYQSRGWASDA